MESFLLDLSSQDTPDMALFNSFDFDQLGYDNSLPASHTSPTSLYEPSLAPVRGLMYIDPSLLASPLSGEPDSPLHLPTPEDSISSCGSDDFSLDQLELAASSSQESLGAVASSLAPVNQRPRRLSTEYDGSNRVSKGRLPHKLVEKKYRLTLISEIERLGRAIPHIAQLNSTNYPQGRPKPSKATIIASAVDYIAKIEAEREELKLRNEEYGVMLRAIGSAERAG